MMDATDQAVDMAVVLSDGSEQRLSQFWESGFVVLVFLRHFG